MKKGFIFRCLPAHSRLPSVRVCPRKLKSLYFRLVSSSLFSGCSGSQSPCHTVWPFIIKEELETWVCFVGRVLVRVKGMPRPDHP